MTPITFRRELTEARLAEPLAEPGRMAANAAVAIARRRPGICVHRQAKQEEAWIRYRHLVPSYSTIGRRSRRRMSCRRDVAERPGD